MVAYIFYCIIIVCILTSLIQKKTKKIIIKKKRYSRKSAQSRYSMIKVMTAKILNDSMNALRPGDVSTNVI